MFRAEQGVDDPEVQAAMEALFDEVAQIDDVTRVESPYAEGGEPPDRVRGRPRPGTIAYANVELPDDIDFDPGRRDPRRDPATTSPDDRRAADRARRLIFAEFEQPSSELLGLAFAIVILIVAFGSVLAMGLPIGVALFGIGIGVGDHHAAVSNVIVGARLRRRSSAS